jgi:membrane fusion protein (multidrug efflux system)
VLPRLLWLGGLLALAALAIFIAYSWWSYRQTNSITEDAFVEAHIINVAPQTVSGHLVRFLVEENDQVEQDQVLAEIDPVPYRDQVNIAQSKVDTARAELRRQQADEARAKASLKLTEDEVTKGIEEAQAGLEAARADLVLAQQEYTRFTNLQKEEAVPLRRAQQVTQARDAAAANKNLAAAKLAKAEADRTRIEVMERTLVATEKATQKAALEVEDALLALTAAEDNLRYTRMRAPFPGVVVKRYRHLGDFASPGVAILSMYNPDLIYVTANLEETRLPGVAPGNPVDLHLDAFAEPFQGRVVWIDKSTGAQFALMPRNVVSGEFTKVVQRVPVRIAIEKDDRWPQLRAGLSVRATIAHGEGDPQWAAKTAQEMKDLETRYNQPPPPDRGAGPGD